MIGTRLLFASVGALIGLGFATGEIRQDLIVPDGFLKSRAIVATDQPPSVTVTIEIEGALVLSWTNDLPSPSCPSGHFDGSGSAPFTVAAPPSITGSDGRDWWVPSFTFGGPDDWTVTLSTPPGASSSEAVSRWQSFPDYGLEGISLGIEALDESGVVLVTSFFNSAEEPLAQLTPARIGIECRGTATATATPSTPPTVIPRVEGIWSVEGLVTGSSFVGEPRDGINPTEPGSRWISEWTIAAPCQSGPCDVAVTSNHASCALAFNGSGWSGNFLDLTSDAPSDGCEPSVPDGPSGPNQPPLTAQPIDFMAVESIETANGLLASVIEGEWAHVGPPKSYGCCPPEWNWYEWVEKSFRATRIDLPVEAESTTSTSMSTASTIDSAQAGDSEPSVTDSSADNETAGAVLETSVMAQSLSEPGEVSTAPTVIATNALLALFLVLLMPFPSELFNQTLDQNYERVTGWWRERAPRLFARRGDALDLGRSSLWALLGVAVAGGVLAGFLDPAFGWSLQSLAVFVGGLLAVAVVMLVSVGISRLYLKRNAPGISVSVRALPGALFIGVACVLLSRMIGFQPGYLYGVLAGLIVVGIASPALEARSAALASGGLGLVALVTWLGWWRLQSSIGSSPGFGVVVLDTFLAAVFVAGLESMVFGLIPMRFLTGEQILKWSRAVWALLFGVSLFAFFQFLAHPGRGYGPTDSAVPFAVAAALFAGFGLLSVGFWAWFRFKPKERGGQ